MAQFLRDHAFDVFRRSRLVAIPKDAPKSAWNDAVVTLSADERSWHDVRLQLAVEPLSLPGISAAIAQKGAIPEYRLWRLLHGPSPLQEGLQREVDGDGSIDALATRFVVGQSGECEFGSEFTTLLGDGVDAILSADFLSADQKADILCNNAARFLRLDNSVCLP